ncbi:hypothetical protein BC940DRAFT_353852 [Gongronella butleri]|nr:hypothetical protein BC940DRAFT_353852 [Gongronella butleri]
MPLSPTEVNKLRLALVEAPMTVCTYPQTYIDLFQVQLHASGRVLRYSDLDGTWTTRKLDYKKGADGAVTFAAIKLDQSVDANQQRTLSVGAHIAFASTFLAMEEDDIIVFKDSNPGNVAVDNLLVVSPKVLQRLFFKYLSTKHPEIEYKIPEIDTMPPLYISSKIGEMYSILTMDRMKPTSERDTSDNPVLQYQHMNLREIVVDPLTGVKKTVTRPWKVQRLMWTIWRGPIDDKMEVDHKNSIPSDNRVVNLQLLSRAENKAKKRHPDAPPRDALPPVPRFPASVLDMAPTSWRTLGDLIPPHDLWDVEGSLSGTVRYKKSKEPVLRYWNFHANYLCLDLLTAAGKKIRIRHHKLMAMLFDLPVILDSGETMSTDEYIKSEHFRARMASVAAQDDEDEQLLEEVIIVDLEDLALVESVDDEEIMISDSDEAVGTVSQRASPRAPHYDIMNKAHYIDHADSNKTNNSVSNLRWTSPRGNNILARGKKIAIVDPTTEERVVYPAYSLAQDALGLKARFQFVDGKNYRVMWKRKWLGTHRDVLLALALDENGEQLYSGDLADLIPGENTKVFDPATKEERIYGNSKLACAAIGIRRLRGGKDKKRLNKRHNVIWRGKKRKTVVLENLEM